MKDYKMFIFVFFIITSIFSQKEDDYINTFELIKKSLNDNSPSLIFNKLDASLKKDTDKAGFEKLIDSLHREKGKMQSYEFLLKEDEVKSYLVEFTNASMLIVLSLNEGGAISVFEIKDY